MVSSCKCIKKQVIVSSGQQFVELTVLLPPLTCVCKHEGAVLMVCSASLLTMLMRFAVGAAVVTRLDFAMRNGFRWELA